MKIITDSTADLPRKTYEREEIGVVPLTIRLGDRTWSDFFDIEPDDYYATLRESTASPVTSQPSPQAFIDAYEPYATKGEPILSIHISSKLSGTYQSAFLARSHFPKAMIEVIDRRSSGCAGSPQQGYTGNRGRLAKCCLPYPRFLIPLFSQFHLSNFPQLSLEIRVHGWYSVSWTVLFVPTLLMEEQNG
ncbi:MAG: DegV family protein [Syntrophorhabdales bacterium]|jgi:hypothetical protein